MSHYNMYGIHFTLYSDDDSKVVNALFFSLMELILRLETKFSCQL